MADLAINFSLSLLEQIINFTDRELKFQGNVAGDIDEVKACLNRIQAMVESKGARSPKVTELLVEGLRVLAYRIEDTLDSIMLHEPNHSPNNRLLRICNNLAHGIRHGGPLHDIHEDIQKIQREMEGIYKDLETSRGLQGEDSRTELQHHLPQALQDAEILGAEVARKKLMSQLINKSTGEKDRSVVVVVGPPGSGKTVLANSVYSGKKPSHHFRCTLGVRLSPYFDVNAVLCLLLSQCRDGKICPTGDSVTDLRNNLKGLNSLIELHLTDAFTGDKLEFKTGAFVSLKVLRIEDFAELSRVEVSMGSMCELEKLTLCKCGQLKTVQMCHISKLKELELFDMPVELTNRLCKSVLDRSRIKVHNPSSSSSNAAAHGPEQNGIFPDLVLPLVQSIKDFASRLH